MTAGVTIHKLGDSIDTDVIIAGRHLASSDPDYLAKHCLAAIRNDFHTSVAPGDLMFAGWNFGCGSSRESAPMALKATGLSCIVAKSFSRIFFRNAVNIGLAALVCPEAVDAVEDGDRALVDVATGRIEAAGRSFRATPLPENLLHIVRAGGLVALMAQRQSRVRQLGSTWPGEQ